MHQASTNTAQYRPEDIVLAQCRRRPTVALLTGEQLFESFAVRYQVYCRERRFLAESDYPDGYETDEFDWTSSTHIGVYGVRDRMIGTVRLVRPGESGMPMDGHCSYEMPVKARVGEISRLAVMRQPTGAAGDERFSLGEVALQLYHGLYQAARAQGVSDLLSAMEPSLERLTRRLYIPFQPIGPLVDYYGWVRPYLLNLDALDRSLLVHAPEIHELFHTPIASADPAVAVGLA